MIIIKPDDIINLENGITLQRLNKDFLWYVIKDNKIIDYSEFREDLIEKYRLKIKKYTVMFIDSQGKISARDENHRIRIFDTLDYPNVKSGDVIEVKE